MLIGQREFDFSRGCHVMGILNVTPDSFSDGGNFLDPGAALDQALKMQEEGADLVDVGAESTRPGSFPIPEEEERKRLLPVLRKIVPRIKIPISIDTKKPGIADLGLREGAAMINDVAALRREGMAEVAARYRVPVILMHMQGEPPTMQRNPSYEDLIQDVLLFLQERMRYAVDRGIDRERILVDPGLGFGKRFEDNLTILNRLPEFEVLGAPLVVGASRKSFLRKIFGEDEKALLLGSAAAAALAASKGASILRVHDVAATKAAIRLAGKGQFS